MASLEREGVCGSDRLFPALGQGLLHISEPVKGVPLGKILSGDSIHGKVFWGREGWGKGRKTHGDTPPFSSETFSLPSPRVS